MDTLKSILQSLGQSTGWQHDAEGALQIRALLGAHLPPELAAGVSASLPEPGILVLSCQNSLIATRIRHIVPTLQDKLKTVGLEVQAIQVDVRAGLFGEENGYRPKRTPAKAPEDAILALETLATTREEGPFKDALLSLAKRLRASS